MGCWRRDPDGGADLEIVGWRALGERRQKMGRVTRGGDLEVSDAHCAAQAVNRAGEAWPVW